MIKYNNVLKHTSIKYLARHQLNDTVDSNNNNIDDDEGDITLN
jgi:hypothetical protein